MRLPTVIFGNMASVTCLFCKTEIRLSQFFYSPSKPFCVNCGWNLDRAKGELGKKARDTWILGGIFVFFLVDFCIIAVRQGTFMPRSVSPWYLTFFFRTREQLLDNEAC